MQSTKTILKEKIENLEEYFSKYKKQDIIKKLEEVKDKLNNQEYKIAVVANMSAGKSTFINSLFGKEVLPAYNHATTDSATYIYSKPNIEKKAEIFFSDKRKSITITEDLEKEIKEYGKKDEDCKDDKYKNVEKIDLYYPFKNLQTSSNEDFSITFIDTPGPNSTGDYGQKHKDQTRSVLNSVDMALFVFDYGQLDANLNSDEQGLWHTIKTRYEKDKNFEVYFLINKIDMSMEDNFKDVRTLDDAKKNWGIHEKKAIDKLKQAAENNGIKEPKIYTVASKFALLDRNDIPWNSPLESFQKKFKQIFTDIWENEYIKYLGIVELENDINNYINTNVKKKILNIANANIIEVENDELSFLNERIQIFSKPKYEAEKSINDALSFLDNEAKDLEDNMLTKFKKYEEKYKQEIVGLISSTIDNELYLKVDEMSKMAIVYVDEITKGTSSKLAERRAKENFNNVKLEKILKKELDKSINTDELMSKMQDFMKTLFDEYKNNYLDVKTDLKNSYASYEREISKIFRQTKESLNIQLQDALDIDIKSIEMKTIDIDSTLSFDVTIPKSILDYKYQEEKFHYESNSTWWNPFSWFLDDTRIVDQEEKHLFIINPQDLKKSIEKNMNETVEKFSKLEQENYTDAIVSLRRDNSNIFQDFRLSKLKEIDKLQEDVKNSEKELDIVEKQLEKFKQII
ncbi:dynamin family protein [Aliarcobacter butzleri]|uniref:dynamin family protein n=1 Tax=Aliarcobacter butzleri TaxID=28197 RepID=UPI002B2508F7|nr:dynamin family protein [Aliarcobacter butzleri]